MRAGLIKFHQTKTTDMIADLFTKPLLSPDHHRLADTMLSDLPERVVQLREEAGVTPKKVTFVDKEMSRDECIIGLEGCEDEKDADMNRSIRPVYENVHGAKKEDV